MFHLMNSYRRLPPQFYSDATAASFPEVKLCLWNAPLAKELGAEKIAEHERAAYFSGQKLCEGSRPLAMAYAGHQYGHFVSSLGDGRALLLGDVVDSKGKHWDLHLKGSGATRFSRGGDGLCTLGAAVREYIVSEAMHGLGIPSTRTLAVVSTGEEVPRAEGMMMGGVMSRVAAGHIRVGTFEYISQHQNSEAFEGLQDLANYCIDFYYPELKLKGLSPKDLYFAFFQAVVDRHLRLVANWMRVGFIHGVMNTDNCSIAGETIDYGPCAFMDEYREGKVFSSIDRHGRYAYGNQGNIILWNLSVLASTLLPLVDENRERGIERLERELGQFSERFQSDWLLAMASKLGIANPQKDADRELIIEFLNFLEERELDFTESFVNLSYCFLDETKGMGAGTDMGTSTSISMQVELQASGFLDRWRKRLEGEEVAAKLLMQKSNPQFIARNHMVERAIQAAYGNDFSLANRMVELLRNPYADQVGLNQEVADQMRKEEIIKLFSPPKPHERVQRTFCGT
jgi:uncharacterized protein YdiU (UPF0061 family)